jgi:hypothetical protein
MRAIWKVTSGELLTKQAMREKIIIYKKIHTYLSYFSTQSRSELRHLYRGISFCMPVSKKSAACELKACFDTFHQLLIIAEVL